MLKVENLIAGYDEKFLLRDINFEVKTGEIFGVIGPNGSGKTTLLRVITKVLKIKKGKVFFNGRDINTVSINELSKEVAVVSQIQNFSFGMTVEEYVALGRIPHRKWFQFFEAAEDERVLEHSLDLTGTQHLKSKLLNELSGGERQLISIARALCQEPKLLLLDEPTVHLDIAHQIQILDLIKRLNKEFNLTVLVILHDLNLASEYCNRLMLLNNGTVYKLGTPGEVITRQYIEEVYKTAVVVKENPFTLKPYVFLMPGEKRDEAENLF